MLLEQIKTTQVTKDKLYPCRTQKSTGNQYNVARTCNNCPILLNTLFKQPLIMLAQNPVKIQGLHAVNFWQYQ